MTDNKTFQRLKPADVWSPKLFQLLLFVVADWLNIEQNAAALNISECQVLVI